MITRSLTVSFFLFNARTGVTSRMHQTNHYVRLLPCQAFLPFLYRFKNGSLKLLIDTDLELV
jgi:hypothetical protein